MCVPTDTSQPDHCKQVRTDSFAGSSARDLIARPMILAAGVYLAIIFQCFSKIGWLFKFYQWCGKSFGASVTTKEMLPSCCYGSQANESKSLVRLRIGCVAFCALSSLTLLAAMSLLSLPLVLSPAWKHTCPDFMIATADTVLWKS